jgi:hypothetical protein
VAAAAVCEGTNRKGNTTLYHSQKEEGWEGHLARDNKGKQGRHRAPGKNKNRPHKILNVNCFSSHFTMADEAADAPPEAAAEFAMAVAAAGTPETALVVDASSISANPYTLERINDIIDFESELIMLDDRANRNAHYETLRVSNSKRLTR